MKVSMRVNERDVSVDVPPMKRLLDVLREDLALTGTKEGCGEGECGACSVLLDGDLVNSCLVPAVQADGAEIVTVEGLSDSGRLSPLQRAFHKHHAAQCGICSPGMLVAARWYLDGEGRLPGEEAREALAGNLCRCTGYAPILDAVESLDRKREPAKRRAPKKPAANKPAGKPAKKATKKKPVRRTVAAKRSPRRRARS